MQGIMVEIVAVEPIDANSLVHAQEVGTGTFYKFEMAGEPKIVGRLFLLSELRLRNIDSQSWPVWGVRKGGEPIGD